MGKKCVPTLIKNGGKKGKDILILGNNDHDCHEKHESKYVPIPIYHQHYSHKPVYLPVKHEYVYHNPIYGGSYYDHGSDYGHSGYGDGGYAGGHGSYDHGGYGNYGEHGGYGDEGYGGYYRKRW